MPVEPSGGSREFAALGRAVQSTVYGAMQISPQADWSAEDRKQADVDSEFATPTGGAATPVFVETSLETSPATSGTAVSVSSGTAAAGGAAMSGSTGFGDGAQMTSEGGSCYEKGFDEQEIFGTARQSRFFGRPSMAGLHHSETDSEDKPKEEQGKPTFFDPVAMKEKVRQNLSKPKYCVSDLYKDKGIWQAIARDANFERLTLVVIAFNAMWIAVDTDFNTAQSGFLLNAHWVFQLAENGFCTFFTFEFVVRLMSFRRVTDGFTDVWFAFDASMVVMMVSETWIFTTFVLLVEKGGRRQIPLTSWLRAAKMMRMCRMCRMARLLRVFPELMIMIKGLLAASRSVFFTLVLLTGLLFVFAIAFTQITDDTKLGSVYFSNVAASMFFLLVHGTLLLSTDLKALEIQAEGGPLVLLFFITFILIAAVLLMNMLIGVLCQLVSAVAATEKEELLVSYVQSKLEKVMAIIDEDGGGTISRDEFMLILENLEAMEALHDVGVDVVGLVDFADFIFGDDSEVEESIPEVELTMPEFMEVILQLRGSNNATVKDIVDLRKFITNSLQQTAKQIESSQNRLSSLNDTMGTIHRVWDATMNNDSVLCGDDLSSCDRDKTPVAPHHVAPKPSRGTITELGVSEDLSGSIAFSIFFHGAWYAVEAPKIRCRMVSADIWSAMKASEELQLVDETGSAEVPYLPATSDGLTGVQVAGFCKGKSDATGFVQDSNTETPNLSRPSLSKKVTEGMGLAPKAVAQAQFEQSAFFLNSGLPNGAAPFLPSTSAGLTPRAL
eukprot:TRINITY_DN19214_c0_g6_i1.p1 TRINITY_DN19214_c0_g6~~TRINITY_DN19214_c0_g6_i1.p1  ORF type:complete len:782 (-),score=142.61 TRINITY_DN19214_c0_g6_i1:121-2466(-)